MKKLFTYSIFSLLALSAAAVGATDTTRYYDANGGLSGYTQGGGSTIRYYDSDGQLKGYRYVETPRGLRR